MKNKVINLFDDTIPNNDVKYSVLLNDFLTPFENDFPDYFVIEDIYDFAVNVWNIGNIAQDISTKDREGMVSPPKMPNDLLKIHEKMLKFKIDKFHEHRRFIIDYSIEEDEEVGFKLVVVAGNEKAYAEILKERLIDEVDDDASFEDGFIDRNAIVLIPKQPFINWINETYPDDKMTLNQKESFVYLVSSSYDNLEEWLKKNYKMFFIMELENWSTDKKDWPKKYTYKMFQQWFSVSWSEMVYDIEQYPVSKV